MQVIRSMIKKHVVGIAKSASISTALTLMRNANVSLLPVIDGGKLVGVITRHKATESSHENLKVKDVMEGPEMCVEEASRIDDVAEKMIKAGVGRLPVVNNKRQMLFLGVITSTEIVREMKR